MSTPDTPPASPEPAEKKSRAGRDLPAAIASGVVLLVVIAASLYFWKPAFVVVVIAAILIGIWELKKGFAVKGIRVSQEPLMVGAVVMLVGAYVAGAPALVTALAVTALVQKASSALAGRGMAIVETLALSWWAEQSRTRSTVHALLSLR